MLEKLVSGIVWLVILILAIATLFTAISSGSQTEPFMKDLLTGVAIVLGIVTLWLTAINAKEDSTMRVNQKRLRN